MTKQEFLNDVRAGYAEWEALLMTLEEEDFTDPSRFREMPATWVPWQVIAGCTCGHYQEHTPSIRAWLAEPAGEGNGA